MQKNLDHQPSVRLRNKHKVYEKIIILKEEKKLILGYMTGFLKENKEARRRYI